MDKKEAVKKVKKYSNLLKDHFPVEMVILYGSYAKSKAREDSDIDVAVIVDETNKDFLTSEVELYKLRRKIDIRIEPVLLERNNDESGFLEQILKEGLVVYSNK
jgi:predicted nucleotidyltransferase